MKQRILSMAVTGSLVALALPSAVSATPSSCPTDWSAVGPSVITHASVGNVAGTGDAYCTRYHAKLSERRGVDVWVVAAPIDLGF